MTAFTCQTTRTSFELYLDGMLPPATAEALEQHLFDCPACASVVGEDIRLGEAVEQAWQSGPVGATARSRTPAWAGWRYVAAASVLLLVGVAAGHYFTGAVSHKGAASDGDRDSVDVVPLTEDDSGVGFVAFTDKEVQEAEREGLKKRIGQTEYRARRSEAALDLMRPLLEETVTPERVVQRLAERVRQAGPGAPPRGPRDDRRAAGGPLIHQMRFATMILRRDPQRSFEPVAAWLRSATTPFERQTAVRLLASLRLPQAYDLLVAEAREGPAQDPALDGLLALRDPRSRDLLAGLVDDDRLPLDPVRVKAAGGLHRLGDPRGLDFLLRTFRSHAAPADKELRETILFHVGSSPGRETAAVLPEILDGINLRGPDRAWVAEWLTLSGMAENDPNLLRFTEPDRKNDKGLVPVGPAR